MINRSSGQVCLDYFSRICLSSDLRTSDPYDVWKTSIGAAVKGRYYQGGIINKGIAGAIYLFDIFLNNRFRIGYEKQEYAIVRALCVQILHSKYKLTGKEEYLYFAEMHIKWLLDSHIKSENGIGWGLNFTHPVSLTLTYKKTTPFSTITPYILEALIAHEDIMNQKGRFHNECYSIFNFFDKDIRVLEQNSEFEVTSYGPFKDRRVVNSVSYTMYSLALLDKYFDYSLDKSKRVKGLFNYIKSKQLADGSWYYSDEGNSFIDCFHSCIILKNLIKSVRHSSHLEPIHPIINKGYDFIKRELWDQECGLYKRFAKQNKPSLIKYDLYDNAELIQCAVLMGDIQEAKKISSAIESHFIKKNVIYSSIDLFGINRNPDMLRWAVMPYLYSQSLIETYENKN